jgi:uncharacterized protein YggT (Ycf19 family)
LEAFSFFFLSASCSSILACSSISSLVSTRVQKVILGLILLSMEKISKPLRLVVITGDPCRIRVNPLRHINSEVSHQCQVTPELSAISVNRWKGSDSCDAEH